MLITYTLAHLVESSILRGLIYSSIWRLTRGLPTGAVLALTAAAIALAWLFSRRPRRRRW